MSDQLRIEVVSSESLSGDDRENIIALCSRAYEEDFELLPFGEATHVLGYYAGRLASHAMWVTRWLQPGNEPPLCTAYVEAVATESEYRNRRFATRVMERLAESIVDFDLGALSPAETSLYSRLGWTFWQGPLFIRTSGELLSTPDERVMVLRLPKTPPLDIEASLSAEWRHGELW